MNDITGAPEKKHFWEKLSRFFPFQRHRDPIESIGELITEQEDDLDKGQKTFLSNVLNLKDTKVEDVMVPRADIKAVPSSISLPALVAAFKRYGRSRMPIYRETMDELLGMVHIKDLVSCWEPKTKGFEEEIEESADHNTEQDAIQPLMDTHFDIHKLLRKIDFVPGSMRAIDLLIRMQETKQHMAIVVDEYGGVDGLVTIEDLVEEIVGEIEDEHEKSISDESQAIKRLDNGDVIIYARMELDAFAHKFHLSLDGEYTEEVDTVGGLVFSVLGRVPGRGEIIKDIPGIEMEILEVDPRRIKRIRIREHFVPF